MHACHSMRALASEAPWQKLGAAGGVLGPYSSFVFMQCVVIGWWWYVGVHDARASIWPCCFVPQGLMSPPRAMHVMVYW